jgi:hypothetical protein
MLVRSLISVAKDTNDKRMSFLSLLLWHVHYAAFHQCHLCWVKGLSSSPSTMKLCRSSKFDLHLPVILFSAPLVYIELWKGDCWLSTMEVICLWDWTCEVPFPVSAKLMRGGCRNLGSCYGCQINLFLPWPSLCQTRQNILFQ